jgi:hypothetical protein
MSDEGRDKLVFVSTRGADALSEPRFIVRIGEKYYLTFGAWEYDESAAETEEQKQGCAEIRDLFRRSPHKIEAAPVPEGVNPQPNIAIKPPRPHHRVTDGDGDQDRD